MKTPVEEKTIVVNDREFGVSISVQQHPNYSDYNGFNRPDILYKQALKEYRKFDKMRIYISGGIYDDFVTVAHPQATDFPHLNLEHIYTKRGDFPEVDKAWDKYNRSIVKAERIFVDTVREQLLKDTMGKAKWSKKAGCFCGCSPGWIVDGEELRRHSIQVFIPKQLKLKLED
jgi:hypothetical protein